VEQGTRVIWEITSRGKRDFNFGRKIFVSDDELKPHKSMPPKGGKKRPGGPVSFLEGLHERGGWSQGKKYLSLEE